MATCSAVPVAILRDGRRSKSAVADAVYLRCLSRASPTSVVGSLRMRAFNFFTRSFAGDGTIERIAPACSRCGSRARLLFLIERHLLRKRFGDTLALVHAPEVGVERRPWRQVDSGRLRPVEHGHQIGVRDGKAVEQVIAPVEMSVEVGEPRPDLVAREGLGAIVALVAEQRVEHELVQLGGDEVEPELEAGALPAVARGEI